MPLRIRLTAATLCAATLVSAIAIIQIRNADADNPQPAVTTTQPAPASVEKDSVYLDFATAQHSTQAAAQKVRDALEKPITVEFKETALNEAVNHIATKCGIKATLNIVVLKEEGIAADEPITLTRRYPAPARAVLNTLLQPLALAVTIENDKLAITTLIDEEEKRDLRLYDASRLVKAGFSHRSLVRLVKQETSGPWYRIDGSGGTIDHFENVLTVRQTETVHAEIARLISTLQRIVEGPEKTGTAPLGMTVEDRKVYAALTQKVTVEFLDTPLTEVAATLGRIATIDVLINDASLAEEGIRTDEPVNASLKTVKLKMALEQILEPLGLDFYVADGALMIDTAICTEERHYSVVFNIREFSEAGYDSNKLIETLTIESSGPWQEIDGTGGTIRSPLAGLLVIRQTWRNIEDCAVHLHKLRTALKRSTSDGRLPKSTADPKTAGLILKQYDITSSPIEDVRNAIPKLVAADSWKSAGGRGELAIIESKLIIHQTREVHEEIEEFLESIGEGIGGGWAGGLSGPIPNFGKPTPGTGLFQVR